MAGWEFYRLRVFRSPTRKQLRARIGFAYDPFRQGICHPRRIRNLLREHQLPDDAAGGRLRRQEHRLSRHLIPVSTSIDP